MKKALITGIGGQSGGYLAELLLDKGYEVHGVSAHAVSQESIDRLYGLRLYRVVKIHSADVREGFPLAQVVWLVNPDEVYNLAGNSFVQDSYTLPVSVGDTVALGALRLLEAVRLYSPQARVLQASSSEMFGVPTSTPQAENTPFHPRSPYGVAKLAAHWYAASYRATYGLFVCSGIFYNHESPRRGSKFVSRKITQAVARIKAGMQSELRLGNLDAERDWGFAGDYMEAAWLMLQKDAPNDYVVATGETHTVREFVKLAFEHVGLDWEKYVVVDPLFYRQKEEYPLRGDISRARRELGWAPQKSFEQLVTLMVDADCSALKG